MGVAVTRGSLQPRPPPYKRGTKPNSWSPLLWQPLLSVDLWLPLLRGCVAPAPRAPPPPPSVWTPPARFPCFPRPGHAAPLPRRTPTSSPPTRWPTAPSRPRRRHPPPPATASPAWRPTRTRSGRRCRRRRRPAARRRRRRLQRARTRSFWRPPLAASPPPPPPARTGPATTMGAQPAGGRAEESRRGGLPPPPPRPPGRWLAPSCPPRRRRWPPSSRACGCTRTWGGRWWLPPGRAGRVAALPPMQPGWPSTRVPRLRRPRQRQRPRWTSG
ncbi:hypothetical protein I4F81_000180 [Pyropia yezoensis]|uniref:Uncharacterized protein n=1 Tax=Pyropia yezoensis TaxID=2788 RepID=A0ACC3BIW5_PYRYE|nr:hypothetical protein I4F81_000180 [Neopyropia yezoensis]